MSNIMIQRGYGWSTVESFTTSSSPSTPVVTSGEDGPSLKICMPSQNSSTYIKCWCTRWDEDNYNIIIETFLSSANRNRLFSHVIPGAERELYNILGKPKFIDSTYSKENTLWLEPISGYGLSSVRKGREVVCKNISDTFINPDYFGIKIEAIRIDNE